MNSLLFSFAVLFIGAQAGVINRSKFENWLGNQNTVPQNSAIEVIEDAAAVKNDSCFDGWFLLNNSCYFIDNNQSATFDMAKTICANMNAKLFTSSSDRETKTMMAHTEIHSYTWTGIIKKTEPEEIAWQIQADIEAGYRGIDFIAKPFATELYDNSCEAFYNGDIQFTFFYSCKMQFHFVCVKNAL